MSLTKPHRASPAISPDTGRGDLLAAFGILASARRQVQPSADRQTRISRVYQQTQGRAAIRFFAKLATVPPGCAYRMLLLLEETCAQPVPPRACFSSEGVAALVAFCIRGNRRLNGKLPAGALESRRPECSVARSSKSIPAASTGTGAGVRPFSLRCAPARAAPSALRGDR